MVRNLNLAQRVVIVIGGALALAFLGLWVATLHGYSYVSSPFQCPKGETCIGSGSFSSQPIYTGLHPWAVMLVWIGLAVIGTAGAVWVLRGPEATERKGDEQPTV